MAINGRTGGGSSIALPVSIPNGGTGLVLQKPTVAMFGTVNNASTTVAADGTEGMTLRRDGNGGGAFDLTLYLRSAPTPLKITAGIETVGCTGTFWEVGLALRDSSTDRRISFSVCETRNVGIVKWTDKDTFNSNYHTRDIGTRGGIGVFLQIEKVATNLVFRLSTDLVNWVDVFTIAANDFLATIDQVGLVIYNTSTSGFRTTGLIRHYKEG